MFYVQEREYSYADNYEKANNDNCEALINKWRKEIDRRERYSIEQRIVRLKPKLNSEIAYLKEENEKGGFGGVKSDKVAEKIIARIKSKKSEKR